MHNHHHLHCLRQPKEFSNWQLFKCFTKWISACSKNFFVCKKFHEKLMIQKYVKSHFIEKVFVDIKMIKLLKICFFSRTFFFYIFKYEFFCTHVLLHIIEMFFFTFMSLFLSSRVLTFILASFFFCLQFMSVLIWHFRY